MRRHASSKNDDSPPARNCPCSFFRDTQLLANPEVYMNYVERESSQDYHWGMRSLIFYFFNQLNDEQGSIFQDAASDLCISFRAEDLQLERTKNLWEQEFADAQEDVWRTQKHPNIECPSLWSCSRRQQEEILPYHHVFLNDSISTCSNAAENATAKPVS